MLITCWTLEHIEQRKRSIEHRLSNNLHISYPPAQILNVSHPSRQELPSGEPFGALVGQHEQLCGGICRIEQDSFGVVIVVCGCVSAASPDLIAVRPQKIL